MIVVFPWAFLLPDDHRLSLPLLILLNHNHISCSHIVVVLHVRLLMLHLAATVVAVAEASSKAHEPGLHLQRVHNGWSHTTAGITVDHRDVSCRSSLL